MDKLRQQTAADLITYEDDGSRRHICVVRFRNYDIGYIEELTHGVSGYLFVPVVDFEPYDDLEPIDADSLEELKGRTATEADQIWDELNARYPAGSECRNGRRGVPGECPVNCTGEAHNFNLDEFMRGRRGTGDSRVPRWGTVPSGG